MTLLNDTSLLEASRASARRVIAAEGTAERRLARLYQRILSRAPTERELAVLRSKFAATLVERGVRFVQLFHPDWDHHTRLSSWCVARCRDTDQASAALVTDLKQRGLLNETLVLWGGEFGRGVAGQGEWDSPDGGRDHHPRCFTMWMAGGGMKAGITHGATDDSLALKSRRPGRLPTRWYSRPCRRAPCRRQSLLV